MHAKRGAPNTHHSNHSNHLIHSKNIAARGGAGVSGVACSSSRPSIHRSVRRPVHRRIVDADRPDDGVALPSSGSGGGSGSAPRVVSNRFLLLACLYNRFLVFGSLNVASHSGRSPMLSLLLAGVQCLA